MILTLNKLLVDYYETENFWEDGRKRKSEN